MSLSYDKGREKIQIFKLQTFLWVYLYLENFYEALQKSVQVEMEG